MLTLIKETQQDSRSIRSRLLARLLARFNRRATAVLPTEVKYDITDIRNERILWISTPTHKPGSITQPVSIHSADKCVYVCARGILRRL